MDRFLLQPSSTPGQWVCTDVENSIVCTFKEGAFNETQNARTLNDFDPKNFALLAKYMREMGDWLAENHPQKI